MTGDPQRSDVDILIDMWRDGDLQELGRAYAQWVYQELAPLYTAVAMVAVTVELALVGAVLWWAWRSDRLTAVWMRRLRVGLAVSAVFGAVRFALFPTFVAALWLVGVVVALLLLNRPTAQLPETDKETL